MLILDGVSKLGSLAPLSFKATWNFFTSISKLFALKFRFSASKIFVALRHQSIDLLLFSIISSHLKIPFSFCLKIFSIRQR